MAPQRRSRWLLLVFIAVSITWLGLIFQSPALSGDKPTVPTFTEMPANAVDKLHAEQRERSELQAIVSRMAKQIESAEAEKAVLKSENMALRSEKLALVHQADEVARANRDALHELARIKREGLDVQSRPGVNQATDVQSPAAVNHAVAAPGTIQKHDPAAVEEKSQGDVNRVHNMDQSLLPLPTGTTAEPTTPPSPTPLPSHPPSAVHTEVAVEGGTLSAWGAILHRERPPLSHRLAVLVPFRNVSRELEVFVPHMQRFLMKQGVDFRIFVINQTDDWRFNRGQLINVGYQLASQSCDYLVMHDVDLLPLNQNLSYKFPIRPMHLASPRIHPKYHYENFIGGVFVISNDDFKRANGLSNRYWGWGREDDDFFMRLTKLGITIDRPENYTELTTGFDTFQHDHDTVARPRDYMKVGKQREVGRQLDERTGVSTSQHTIITVAEDHVATGESFIRVEVNLTCDEADTPWCRWYTDCKYGYYRPNPGHRICLPCAWRCWTGFVLAGHCTKSTTPKCLKVGRDISAEDAAQWPKGTVKH
mmetsp:Transcript_4470/g.11376  ORF Transcript_4470/g.11376 Transcript_4470/m.11376 type:complete len:536 (-) Transcript_4470:140-1747(-)